MTISTLLVDLCAISAAGVVFGFVARAVRLPTMVGFLFAGYFIGPHSPINLGTISDTTRVQQFAELGIILLIFTVGLELGFKRIKSLGMAPLVIGVLECLGIWFLATQTAKLLGYSSGVSQFIGAAIAISSTTVILATLNTSRLSTAKFSDNLVGILIVEDLIAIIALMYLPAVAQGGGDISILQVSTQLAVSVLAWWLGGSIVVPKIANIAQRFGGDELLLLASLGLCLGLSVIAVSFNFSSALGAFIMGAILADSRQNRRIENLIRPLRQIFGILFFVSFGMLFNPAALTHHIGTFFIFLAILVVGKFTLALLAALAAGQELRDSLKSAAFLGVVGEFSFVIVEVGLGYKFLPEEIFPLVVGIAVASVIVSPILALLVVKHADTIANLVPPRWKNAHKSYVNTMRALRVFRSHQSALKGFAKRTHLRWFLNKLQENYRDLTSATTSATLNRLAPWDEYLSEIVVEQSSHCEGKSLEELNTRSAFEINIVGVERNMNSQIPPDPKLRLLPGDALLAYGTEENLEAFAKLCRPLSSEQGAGQWLSLQDCDLHAVKLSASHVFVGKTLRELNLRVAKSVTVLAVVREGERIKNPPADLSLRAEDEVFVVGPRTALSALPNL
jgi:CPA2 family monovalent cation:H+ antiporter-2